MTSIFLRRIHSLNHDSAQTLAEYSVLIGFLAIVVAAAVPSVGNAVRGLYEGVAASFGG